MHLYKNALKKNFKFSIRYKQIRVEVVKYVFLATIKVDIEAFTRTFFSFFTLLNYFLTIELLFIYFLIFTYLYYKQICIFYYFGYYTNDPLNWGFGYKILPLLVICDFSC